MKPTNSYDFDVTLVEDVEEWDNAPTADLVPERKRATTAVQSPIEQSVLLELCRKS